MTVLSSIDSVPQDDKERRVETDNVDGLPSLYLTQTEPPLNPPENRENTAEIFFEVSLSASS